MPSFPPPEEFFKAAQTPGAWLATAQGLAEAAKAIVGSQEALEEGYQRACEIASAEAEASENGIAEIRHVAPNYLPAGLLYGFAIENALKGLIVAKQPGVVSESKIGKEIHSHDLVVLAKRAGLALSKDECEALSLLSIIVEWAGRYPVAAKVERHQRPGRMPVTSSSVLEWSRWRGVILEFIERAHAELEMVVKQPRNRFDVMVLLRD
jgi:hypothetical protein